MNYLVFAPPRHLRGTTGPCIALFPCGPRSLGFAVRWVLFEAPVERQLAVLSKLSTC